MKKLFVISSLSLLILTGCIAAPPKMSGDRGQVLALRLKIYESIKIFTYTPKLVYFAKVDEKNRDLKDQSNIVFSNYCYKYNVYLFNAEPGTYAAIAATYKGQNDILYTLLFPKELIEKSLVTLKPGEVAFMGNFTVKKPFFSSPLTDRDYDSHQLNYYRKLSLFTNRLAEFLLGDAFSSSHLDSSGKNREREREFLKTSRPVVKNTKWNPLFKRRLAEVGD